MKRTMGLFSALLELSRMHTKSVDLLSDMTVVSLHNSAHVIPPSTQEFRTDEEQWGYSLSFPVSIPLPPVGDVRPTIAIDVEVLDGRIGVGCLDEGLQHYLTSEINVPPANPNRVVTAELQSQTWFTRGHVMVRNTGSGGARARFRLHGARLFYKRAQNRLLVPDSFQAAGTNPVSRKLKYLEEGLASDLARLPLILIYQVGKVGSQTIEATLRHADLPYRIKRLHIISPHNIKKFGAHLTNKAMTEDTKNSLRQQLDDANRLYHAIIARKIRRFFGGKRLECK